MTEKIKKFLQRVLYELSKDSCYYEMEARGYAQNGCCGGVMGGDRDTGYLNSSCIDCPYFSFSFSFWKDFRRREMTEKEAIKRFEPIVDNEAYADHFQEACKLAIQALSKQILKKPIRVYDEPVRTDWCICSNCHKSLGWFHNRTKMFCPNCGQAIDWGKE